MFDILIIGGGHAGVEAAQIASQFKNLKIGIISLPGIGLASAPCNPSVGGVGKGQVVREIDALGGITGKLADLSGIQFRTLNESKGYAVQSTRIQIDKVQYSIEAEKIINSISNIELIREKVTGIEKVDDFFSISTNNSKWTTKKLIITVGTFLNGKMHTGSEQSVGGRIGCESTDSISDFFKNIKTNSLRFKTGTPPRLDGNTLDYSKLHVQPSDNSVRNFHVLHGTFHRSLEQKNCYLTYTNSSTMDLIRDNKELSPMFNGQINAVGARYCPSIEDKAYRYPDKDVHHIFIEPESLSLNSMYPSGISSSLPKNIQKKFMNTIVGLENAEITEYGYAVEYDVIDTTELDLTLQLKSIPNLYFAGQVNGTSGYEEAAGQGLIAGVNAALSLMGLKKLILSRIDSYIGVMIEDLVTNIRDEPYRLFTARSENRLFIREDNAILRMKGYRDLLHISSELDIFQERFCEDYLFYVELFEDTFIGPQDKFITDNNISISKRMTVADIIRQSSVDPIDILMKYFEKLDLHIGQRLLDCLAISIKYSGYINRSNEENKRMNRLSSMKLDWRDLVSSENISFECKKRIEKIKPETFGQLKLIEGIRPATLAAVAGQRP